MTKESLQGYLRTPGSKWHLPSARIKINTLTLRHFHHMSGKWYPTPTQSKKTWKNKQSRVAFHDSFKDSLLHFTLNLAINVIFSFFPPSCVCFIFSKIAFSCTLDFKEAAAEADHHLSFHTRSLRLPLLLFLLLPYSQRSLLHTASPLTHHLPSSHRPRTFPSPPLGSPSPLLLSPSSIPVPSGHLHLLLLLLLLPPVKMSLLRLPPLFFPSHTLRSRCHRINRGHWSFRCPCTPLIFQPDH